MKLTDFIIAQNENKNKNNFNTRKQSTRGENSHLLCQNLNYELTSLWYSEDQSLWVNALNNYWNYVKPANRNLEEKMEHLNWQQLVFT